RLFGKRSAALLAASAIPFGFRGVSAATSGLVLQQSEGFSTLPKFVVEDFSKAFDPAYLSNGLISIRPDPNPLIRAQTYISGFDFEHPTHKMECLSPAPYPLETDIRIKHASLLKSRDLVKVQRQTLDTNCGELITQLEFAPD